MSTSTKELLDKCRKWCQIDPASKNMSTYLRDLLIKESIIQTDRELRRVDSLSPLAWDIVPYSGLQTIGGAEIDSITQADPGVISADQLDTDITGHGFDDHSTITDIVVIDGIDGMDELNMRMFLVEYIDADTFSLKSLDGLSDIDTTDYEEYSSGGYVYHAGFVLNTTTILTDVSSEWTFKRMLPNPTFDGLPTDLISENVVRNEAHWLDISYAARPKRWRYWQNMTAITPTVSHYFFWYPVANQVYNIAFEYQKEIADISAWTSSTYPFHPDFCSDALWHGALAKLAGSDGVVIVNANRWIQAYENDKIDVINHSRELMGAWGGMGGLSG